MIITGMFLRLISWRAGAFCIQHTNRSGPSALSSRTTAISLGSLTGGSHVIGTSVGPHARALPVPMMVASNGGPDGSIATIALTSAGRASAISQPNAPDCEWVSTIAGPILSRRAAPARSEEHTSELQSLRHLVCRLLLEK